MDLTERVEYDLNPRNPARLAPQFIGQLADHCGYSDWACGLKNAKPDKGSACDSPAASFNFAMKFWIFFGCSSLMCPKYFNFFASKILANGHRIHSIQFSASVLSLRIVAACFQVFPNSQHSPAKQPWSSLVDLMGP